MNFKKNIFQNDTIIEFCTNPYKLPTLNHLLEELKTNRNLLARVGMIEEINSVKELLFPRLNLRYGYKLFMNRHLSFTKTSFSIDDINFDCKEIIASKLCKAEFIAFFAGTAGLEIENISHELFQQDNYSDGYFVNEFGSLIAESLAQQCADEIEEIADSMQLSATNRYSPGYCGWQTDEQKKLFSLLPDGFCGIFVNESSLMSPIKSVSGIIGIGKNCKKAEYSCAHCKTDHCNLKNTMVKKRRFFSD